LNTLKNKKRHKTPVQNAHQEVCRVALTKEDGKSQAVKQVASTKWIAVVRRRQNTTFCWSVFYEAG